MDDMKNKINNIRENLLEAVKLNKKALLVFEGVRRATDCKEDNYDFEEFANLDIFDQIEQENIDNNKTIDRHLKFIKMDCYIKESIKISNNKQRNMYAKFMTDFKNVSDEIHASYSVAMFLKYWDEKSANDFELKEYPAKFMKCFEKIPHCVREKLRCELSDIKRFPETYNDQMVSLKNFEVNERLSNQIDKSNNLETSKFRLSDDKTFGEDILAKYKDRGTNFNRGNTQKLNLSVLDFTVNYGSEGSFPTKQSSNRESSFELADLDQSNVSNISNIDVLNQAIHETSVTGDGMEPILSGSKQFVDSDHLKIEESDSFYPQIEKLYTEDDGLDSVFNLTFGSALYHSQLGGKSKMLINESCKLDEEESISCMNESKSRQLNVTDLSLMDSSNYNLGYSFNNNSNVKIKPLDEDDD